MLTCKIIIMLKTILILLDDLKEKDLYKLKEVLNKKIIKCEENKMIQTIINKIDDNGYSWIPKKVDVTKICSDEIACIEFPLNLRIETYDRDDKSDCHVIDRRCKQNDWEDKLYCDYEPCDDDDFEIPFGSEHWESQGGFDEPIKCTTKMMIQVFYKKIKPKTPKFKAFDKDGNIKEWKLINSKLYCGNEYIGLLDNWKDYNIFMVPH
jgi:hypothetical protein